MYYQDRELFKGAAWYYARFRPPYPEEVFQILVRRFHLDGKGALLDLGCGPGDLAIPLHKYFARVYAVDVDADMLQEGKEKAEHSGADNVEWIQDRAEEAAANCGQVRLVTIGKAFHWMDERAVLSAVYPHIEKGGGIVLLGETGSMWAGTKEWQTTLISVVKKYLGQERRAGKGMANLTEDRWNDLLQEYCGNVESLKVTTTSDRWAVDTLLGYLYSTSFCSKALLGENVKSFEEDMRKTLLKLNPSGIFEEEIPIDMRISSK